VEDGAHGFRLTVDDDESAVPSLVAERRHPAHPHPLLFRGGDLVADPLAGDLALELGEGQQNVEGQPSHRGRRVELLRHRNERCALGVEDLDDLGKVGERAGQPVDLVDNHDVDPTSLDLCEQLLQRAPFHRGAGEPAIVIIVRQAHPPLVPLALDEGLTRFALRLQRIELLFEPLLGRLAGVDRATDGSIPSRHVGSLPSHGRAPTVVDSEREGRLITPKNRGPDQWAPVIRAAIIVSER
jgi:hypothetical protein